MTFEFDLVASDYIAMSWHLYGGMRSLFRASTTRGLIIFLVFVFFGVVGWPNQSLQTLLVSVAAGSTYAFLAPLWWRWRWLRQVNRYYSSEPFTRLFGRHVLTLADEGIRSEGPHHETLRRWPAITKVALAPQHLLISTIFGNVYVLPLSVVDTPENVRAFVSEKIAGSRAPSNST